MRYKFSGLSFVALIAVILLGYQNCSPLHEGDFAAWNEQSSSSTGLPPFPPALATALSTSCSSCHLGAVNSPEAFVSTVSLDSGPWVNRADPENSLVLLSVLKQAPAPAQGMPQGESGAWASAEDLRSWLKSLSSSGGGGDMPPPDLGPATFSSVNVMIQEYCISCHGAGDQYPLTNYSQVMNYVDASGGASLGELYQNIADGSMPESPVFMSDAVRESVQDLLFDWIAAGAPNN